MGKVPQGSALIFGDTHTSLKRSV